MSLLILPSLYLSALLGHSALGIAGVAVTALGLAGLALALVAAIRRPSWRLLWLLLPLAIVQAYMEVVAIRQVGDHDEALTVIISAFALLIGLGIAAVAARANRMAVIGAAIFVIAYAWIAYQASLFVFWNGLH